MASSKRGHRHIDSENTQEQNSNGHDEASPLVHATQPVSHDDSTCHLVIEVSSNSDLFDRENDREFLLPNRNHQGVLQ